MDDDEIAALLDAAESMGRKAAALVALLTLEGMKLGEVLAMDVRAVHVGDSTVAVEVARNDFEAPAAYSSSCSLQAWAAAAPLLWLRVLLGLDPWTTRSRVWGQPRLPSWLEGLHVEGVTVGRQRLSIRVSGLQVGIEGGDLAVLRERRPALAASFEDESRLRGKRG